MDSSSHWPQVVVKRSMEEEEEEGKRAILERKAKGGGKDQILKCPRCNSNNTKFCYYNNYSLSQPRYFCKSCRRYWTAGGSLRNIPVGGASRKNKRPAPNFSSPSPKNKTNDGADHQANPMAIMHNNNNNSSSSNSSSSCGWLLSDRVELIPFMPMPAAAAAAPQPSSMCSTAADYNPSRNTIVNGFGDDQGGSARSLFSVEELKQLPTIINDQNGGKLGDHVAGFWNGIFWGCLWPMAMSNTN